MSTDVSSVIKSILPVNKRLKPQDNDNLKEAIDLAFKDNDLDPRILSQTFIDHKHLIQDGISPTRYIKALTFVTYIMVLDINKTEAYKRTFPDRLAKNSKNENSIKSNANTYFYSQLVQKVMALVDMPVHLSWFKSRFKALGVLEEVMEDPNESGFTRVTAADKLLQHTKMPDELIVKGEVEHKHTISDPVSDLLQQVSVNAKLQRASLLQGTSLEDMQKLGLRPADLAEKQEEDDILDVEEL